MSKKVIGIPGWSVGELSFGVGKTYMNFIREFGKPRILSPEEDDIEALDGLLLPGGADLSPANYGEMPSFFTQPADTFKEYFFRVQLPKYIAAGVPVFGICLGFQQINVHFGGKLCQHLFQHDSSPDRYKKGHEVYFENEHLLGYKALKKEDVNSHHHQAVFRSMLGEGLLPIASTGNKEFKRENDDIIEAFIHETLPIGGVQWHPEEWGDWQSRAIFRKILNKK